MNIGNHGSDVSRTVWLAVRRVLDALEVLLCRLVEVERVTLVERVDLSPVGDADVGVGKDEFSEGLDIGDEHRQMRESKLELTSSSVKPLTPCPVERTKLQLLPYMV